MEADSLKRYSAIGIRQDKGKRKGKDSAGGLLPAFSFPLQDKYILIY
ncbi:hypothetical protein HMPREF9442_03334 [Paraprevotella xylaniphila YIT 11841]|uniref:Uncharacterized protein n=1 Tax=Paraprevotella xylaniphila YIT 11841 TaxID=762982 RepID=F3QYP0_9BACT|nr:hypothetical protein HMPREF9442_03334 [Paraprevotella xylaniphila YIT 11841]